MLIGRDGERARLRAVVRAVRDGRGTALVVRGEPGIGKTTLLDDLRASASGVRTLHVRAVESEGHLAFAGLADVLRPLLPRRDALPSAQRMALEAALALGPPAVPDRFAAYAAALGLLTAAAAEEPLLVLIDDAQWLDRPSQEAILFAARRIEDDPIGIVATSREAPPEDLDVTGIEELRLPPLDEAASRRLLAGVDAEMASDVSEALLSAADGNPLALTELARALTADERAGRVALPRAFRAGEGVIRAYRARIEHLSPGARRAVLLAALGEDRRELGQALADAGGGAADLAEAEAAGLLTVAPDQVAVRHPIIRSAVLGVVTPAERRAAHRALADASDPRTAPEARAWHLAEAAAGQDEEAAAALDAAAMAAAGRTGYAAAAAALERAADLGAAAARPARLVGAAGMALAAGRASRALRLLGPETIDDPGAGVEASHLRGLVQMLTGDLDGAFQTLVEQAERRAAADPMRAAAMLGDAVLTRTMAGRCHQALDVARRAYAVARTAPAPVPTVEGYLAGALVLVGEARAAHAHIARFDAVVSEVDPLSPQGPAVVAATAWRPWVGGEERVAALLDRWIATARTAAAVGFLPFPLAFACEVDFRIGRWTLARARGEEAMSLLPETGQMGLTGYVMCNLARVEAGIGMADAATARAGQALAGARALGVESVLTYASAVLGFQALSEGDAARAVEPLEEARDAAATAGLVEPATVPWEPDLVEAYARSGRTADCRRQLASLAERAHRTGGTWALAATARCRGLIDDDIDRHFGEALALHAHRPLPFERARTDLAYGARLRRMGRRTEARGRLERALATFDDLGAQPWARQAREEIAASGARLRPRGHGPPAGELSPRELQVALAVAEGATNREAAARLFLSEKTIERHLGSVYRKLGVRSRTELARRIAAGEPPISPAGSPPTAPS